MAGAARLNLPVGSGRAPVSASRRVALTKLTAPPAPAVVIVTTQSARNGVCGSSVSVAVTGFGLTERERDARAGVGDGVGATGFEAAQPSIGIRKERAASRMWL